MVGQPSSSSSSWRNPSAEVAAKYNLTELPESFVPTPQEQDLLKMYERVATYEKEAKRIREEQARTKLISASGGPQQSMSETGEGIKPKPIKARKKKVKRQEEGMMDGDEDDVYSSEEEEETMPQSKSELREKELEKMREDLEEAKHTEESKAAAAEEALRAELLNEEGETATAPGPSLLKRKRKEETTTKSSLLANIANHATPPHEFSKKLELEDLQGRVLFPTSSEAATWSPPPSASQPNEGALNLELPDFDISQAQHGQGNNTIVIKFTSPTDAKRFSLNIAAPDHADFYSVLFHFNPRALERGGQLVINDKKEGSWGRGINVPLSDLPVIFGQVACTLVIQINGDGFDVFMEDEKKKIFEHCARLEHRQQLPSGKCSLFLQFPSTDDYGSPELWTVYRVWWGNKKSMAKSDISGVHGVNVFSGLHPRKLFVSGLHRISTQPEVDLRRAELERAFRKYGGDHGIIATVPMNTTFAFVELESERQADLALQEMQDQYRLNRARRSRHEALQEERAAAEAAKEAATTKDSSGWD